MLSVLPVMPGTPHIEDQEDSGARPDSVPAAHRLLRLSILLPILRHKIPIGESYTFMGLLSGGSLTE